ncbi:MFS transporter [Cellulomonas sp. ATA003]|uniref:MFS transporter n=1 Tax=Cellulomonas sp. ATA003 TaxID=3073064 RepID=UPI0028733801|nr:MFS transporter [Cellulomonas sp. ATA003]WNB87195.1 MFS transporter [Cellulomonas sp. ATA003]
MTAPATDVTAVAAVPAVPLLRRRAFRFYVSAQLLGSSGIWMLRMATDWLVLDLTGSPAAVGLLVALQFLPLFVVGPMGGVLADRYDRRRLVLGTQTCSAAVAAGLAALTLTGVVTVGHLYVAAVVLGLVAAVELPARQALVGEVVGDASLRSAVSMNNALNQGGGLVGPAVAGIVIAQVGQGWAFGANAVVCLAVVALIAAIRPGELIRAPVIPRARGQLREGFRFVAQRPHLLWVVVLAGLMGALGMNGPVVLASFADGVWGTGAQGFGLYNTVSAVGALLGAVLAARLARLRARVLVLGAALFAVTEAAAAVMPTHLAFVIALGAVGAATLFFLTCAATYVQLAADPSVRGRVLGIYSPSCSAGTRWARCSRAGSPSSSAFASASSSPAGSRSSRPRPSVRRSPAPATPWRSPTTPPHRTPLREERSTHDSRPRAHTRYPLPGGHRPRVRRRLQPRAVAGRHAGRGRRAHARGGGQPRQRRDLLLGDARAARGRVRLGLAGRGP